MASATAKKVSAPKKPRSHPPYADMISEAIMGLKERTGSSQVAIAKFIEEKQKDLPSNFRKLLLVQLKKLVASGKLTKVKNSFKLAVAVKPTVAPAKKEPAAEKVTKAVTQKKKAVVKKAKVATPAKKVAVSKVKKAPVKKVAVSKVKKTPVKKVAVSKVKKTPVKKVVKKPKSIKSPAKKAKK